MRARQNPPARPGPGAARLTEGNVPRGLFRLAIPMVFGMLGMVVFNVTDTFFVSRLGADQLAALSFTFPVVMILNALAQGIGMSSSALVSRAVGETNPQKVERLATDSLALGVAVLALIVSIGLFTIRPLFTALGAEGIILDHIAEYMVIWYWGSIMVVIPMIGNNIIRGLGDSKTPGTVMAISASVNVLLDPLLIFGLGPFPALGIRGAAIATVLARSLTAVVALYVLIRRERIIRFTRPTVADIWYSWRQLLYIAVPNALINMALPLGSAFVTRILAAFGPAVVAGFGVATRVEMFSLLFINALGSVTGPYIGQNLGGKLFDRVHLARRSAESFCIVIGVIAAIVLASLAEPIARIFSPDPEVLRTAVLYLRIVPAAYGFQGILRIGSITLNVLGRPFHSAGLTVLQTFGIYIPLAALTSRMWGVPAIFVSLGLSYLIGGSLAHLLSARQIQAAAEKETETAPPSSMAEARR